MWFSRIPLNSVQSGRRVLRRPPLSCSHCDALCWKIPSVNNRKHLESSGPITGLWVRTAAALRKAGYKSRRKDQWESAACLGRRNGTDITDYPRRLAVELGLDELKDGWRGSRSSGSSTG